jgi:hypothetical protein
MSHREKPDILWRLKQIAAGRNLDLSDIACVDAIAEISTLRTELARLRLSVKRLKAGEISLDD